MIITLTSI